mgnify:FL=1
MVRLAIPFRFAHFVRSLWRLARRGFASIGQNPSPVRGPEIDAYQALSRLRRKRAARAAEGKSASVLRSVSLVGDRAAVAVAVDDPQVNLRITI